MPRDIQRQKAKAQEDLSGLSEFAPTEKVTSEMGEEQVVKSGWASSRRPPNTSNSSFNRFSVPENGDEVVIKFLDEIPFAGIYQHWVVSEGQRRAYTCLGSKKNEETGEMEIICPLCKRGDRAKPADYFNVIMLSEDGSDLKVWITSSDPSKAIQERAENKRTKPINKDSQYFAVSKKKGKNNFFTYSVDPVREDELESDWNVKPLTEEEITQYEENSLDASVIKIHTKSELQEVAKLLED